MKKKRLKRINMELKEGEYKKHNGIWYARPPASENMVANLKAHSVIEHEDGTITVSPSILITTWNKRRWHGYLKNGIFERLADSNV
jgi:hypothetical protein